MRPLSEVDADLTRPGAPFELEEALVRADVGVDTATGLIEALRERAETESISEPVALIAAFKADLKADLEANQPTMGFGALTSRPLARIDFQLTNIGWMRHFLTNTRIKSFKLLT